VAVLPIRRASLPWSPTPGGALVLSGGWLTWTGWLFGAVSFLGLVYQVIDARKQRKVHQEELATQEAYAREQRAHAAKVEEHNRTLQGQLNAIQLENRETEEKLQLTIQEHGRLRPVWSEPNDQDLGVGFVGRRELLDWILGTIALDRNHRIIVLYGRPGIGKSRIALHLAAMIEPEAKHPFRGDGLLWSELGKTPDQEDILLRWYTAGGGAAGNPGNLSQAVSDLLSTRHPLVIMDDVRSVDDIAPLIDATPGCPTLVTTADERVADAIIHYHSGAIKHEVMELTGDEADELLRERISLTLGTLPPQYIARLTQRVDADPFSIIQLGSYVTDTLRRSQGSVWQSEDLDDVLFSPFAGPDLGTQHGSHVGQERNISGTDLYRARIQESLEDAVSSSGPAADGVLDAAARRILQLMTMLRPRPESFSAAEIAEIAGGDVDEESAERNLGELARRSFVIREEPDPLTRDAGGTGDHTAHVYSLHRLARRTIQDLIPVERGAAARTHRRAARYWSGVVDPNRDAASSYLSALNREGHTWQRGSRNLLYHLGQMKDRHAARLAFDKVYFELFWWWGLYLRYPVLEDLLGDWKSSEREYATARERAEDDRWLRAITAFQEEYRPAHDGTFFQESDLRHNDRDWTAVEVALTEILAIDHLDGDPAGLADHVQWHTRALIEFFLADACRFRGLTDQVDRHYATLRQLLTRCVEEQDTHQEDCAWNLAWLDYEEADNALDRAARGDSAQYAVAIAQAASSIRCVLTEEPAEEGGAAKLMARPEIDDWEILALACRAWGDAIFAATGPVEATDFYRAAAVFAFAWQYFQKTTPSTDAYTQTFYGDILRHIVGKLQAAHAQDPARAAEMVSRFLEIRGAFGASAQSDAAQSDASPKGTRIASQATYFRESFPRQAFGIANVRAPYAHQPAMPAALPGTVDQMLTRLWHEVQKTAAQPQAALPGPEPIMW
jgi:NB-ARC domain